MMASPQSRKSGPRLMRTVNMTKKKLIDLVLDQIEYDIDRGDLTAIEELLKYLPKERLRAYLPEEIYG